MEKLAAAFNKAFAEAGIKTPNDFRKIKVDVESEEKRLSYGLEGLHSIFTAWLMALESYEDRLQEVEELMLQDPFLEQFVRVSLDRSNKMIVINHEGSVFHIFENSSGLKLKLDNP